MSRENLAFGIWRLALGSCGFELVRTLLLWLLRLVLLWLIRLPLRSYRSSSLSLTTAKTRQRHLIVAIMPLRIRYPKADQSMLDYLLLMHADAQDTVLANSGELWTAYFLQLRDSGRFDGGSAIGAGKVCRKAATPEPIEGKIVGYLRVRADNIEDAARFLRGNPVYEAGGTVEIRALPRD